MLIKKGSIHNIMKISKRYRCIRQRRYRFSIYDRISSRMQQFKISITMPVVTDIKKLTNFARELQKKI